MKRARSFLGRNRGDETLTSSEKEKSETPHVVSYGEIAKIGAVVSGGAAFPGAQFSESSSRRQEALTSSEASGKKEQSLVTSAATIAKIDAVAAAARELRRVRAGALPKLKGGLRALYRTLEWTRSRPRARPSRAFCFAKWNSRSCEWMPKSETVGSQLANLSPLGLFTPRSVGLVAFAVANPFRNLPSCSNPKRLKCPGANPLKDAHAALETAILTAYGFSPKKDLLAQLLALNQDVAAKIEKGEPVMPPGVPKNYPDAQKLVTEDCIRPAGA